MLENSTLEPLRTRQLQIAKRRSDLAARMDKLRREDEGLAVEADEIATTLKTLSRVYGLDVDGGSEIKGGRSTGGHTTKPDGTPTLFEMVTEILEDRALIDSAPVEGDLIYEEIRRRWWPEAPRNSIIPSLWRFSKEERLVKDGTAYGLVLKNETPGGATPGVSNAEEDFDDETLF